ncbi:MAG TPA: ribulose-phosphate 3-epimerase [Syntrophorhabdaceae bacterium]|nr:ribulose-phosphate 3-epimerase [Syntrophorhabdaceae bacterium]
MNMIKIAPSILSCDFLKLGQEIKDVEKAGADLIHVDVMDGQFVPNITIGPMFVEAIKKIASLPLDVHLMIKTPSKFVPDFIARGADMVTVHVEADKHLFRTIDLIKSSGGKAGISFNPSTPLSFLDHVIHVVDLVMIMTVNPGFGGQAYIPSMEEKIRNTRKLIDKSGRQIALEVDGGIKAENVHKVVEAGADVLVMGTEIFHSADYAVKIREIREKIGL